MKRFLLILSLCFLGQWATAQKVNLISSTDTLTNADTVTVAFAYHQDKKLEYEFALFADSLSGSTAGTALLQHKLADSGSDWYTLSTVTIDGVTTSGKATGTVLGGEFRIYTTSTGTQSTALRSYIAVTKSRE